MTISEITPQALLSYLEVVALGGVVIARESISIQEDEVGLRFDVPDLIESSPPSASVPIAMRERAQAAELRRLSNREQAILREIMQGASNKHIARSLDIAEATVKVHVKSLLRKLRVSNRTQAAMWATAHYPRKGNEQPRRDGQEKSLAGQMRRHQNVSTDHDGDVLTIGASPVSGIDGGQSSRISMNPASPRRDGR